MISIGIDAAKGKSTVCILEPYGEVVVPPRDISHTASELSSLIFLIKSLGEPVKVVMESTGTYHYPIAILRKNRTGIPLYGSLNNSYPLAVESSTV